MEVGVMVGACASLRASRSPGVFAMKMCGVAKWDRPRLTSVRAQKDASFQGVIPIDYIGNAIEVKEWESGKSFDEIAARQGIKIRRYPPEHLDFTLENEEHVPCNILEKIIWSKNLEVKQFKETKPLAMLKSSIFEAPPVRDFIGALEESYSRTGTPALIAEVKKASPSIGVLRRDFDPVEIARAYEEGGAACLSVLTDEFFFQGSFENLEKIRTAGVKVCRTCPAYNALKLIPWKLNMNHTLDLSPQDSNLVEEQCPLLCKEFVIDDWQIYYARIKGADAILLIAAVLTDLDIKYFLKICRKIGLAALVEVHNEREMDRVLGINGIQLIGINNRDLETFEVHISNTKILLEGERGGIIRQRDIMVVGESGLFTPADIACVHKAGVKAVLVGESIVKQKNPKKGITSPFGKDIS